MVPKSWGTCSMRRASLWTSTMSSPRVRPAEQRSWVAACRCTQVRRGLFGILILFINIYDIFRICQVSGAHVVGGVMIDARHQRLDSQQSLRIASGRDNLAAVAQCLGRNRLDCASQCVAGMSHDVSLLILVSSAFVFPYVASFLCFAGAAGKVWPATSAMPWASGTWDSLRCLAAACLDDRCFHSRVKVVFLIMSRH